MIGVHHTKLKGVWYGVAMQEDQILATHFSIKEPDLRRLLKRLPDDESIHTIEEPNQLLTNILRGLEEIFNGNDRESYGFKIAMNQLSNYSRRVLNYTCLVPVGYVTSYSALANVAGGSARSVGRVEASNPFPLLIPCHRVVRSDFSVGGYGYGKRVKLEILQREKRGYEESRGLEVEGKKLSLFPAEWVNKNRDSF